MHIDWSHFTPVSALAGGMIIGAAASMLLLLNGRIAGISGHGVCGLSSLSPRSLAATLCFMLAGFATVYLLRQAAV